MDTPPRIPTATLRQLAVSAGVDPRTIRAVAEGRPVRGMAGERARVALLTAGYTLPALDPADKEAAPK
ncbi:MAG: hypothetical protein HY369_02860 [Candidatus Aenigmarchaeota archaeon]|nr:hypothetical protein [Candidatus Aenigmarchaeota archaeon]